MASGKKRKGLVLSKKVTSRKAKNSTAPAKAQMSPSRVSVKTQKPGDHSSLTRDHALAVLARMRREHISLSKASREEHIKPATVRRYVGSALRRDKPGGPFRATKGDSFRRDLKIPTAQGSTDISIPVYGSKNASLVASYSNAVSEYLRTGKRTKLDSFKGKTVKVDGNSIELITDPALLESLAEANVLHFDQLYASATGRG
jgi:hypothetical protein